MLDLINNRFVMDPDLMLYPEFRALWDRDLSEDKYEAIAFLSYVFNMHNPKSPYYKNYVGRARQEAIISEVLPDTLKKHTFYDDAVLIKAEAVYINMLRLSPLRNVLEISKQVIADVSGKLMNPKIKRDVKLLELTKLNKAIEEYKKAERLVDEDEINNVKGDRHIKGREH